jgi:hypothetical protein
MPLELQIIRAAEFVRLGTRGHLDLTASRAVLSQLAGACRRRGIDRALLDLREVRPAPTPMLTPSELGSLVNTFREIGFSHKQRLAVLYSADPHHGARLFASLSRLRGWTVRAFGGFEDAINWLALTKGVCGESGSKAAGEEIPVRSGKSGHEPPSAKVRIIRGQPDSPITTHLKPRGTK